MLQRHTRGAPERCRCGAQATSSISGRLQDGRRSTQAGGDEKRRRATRKLSHGSLKRITTWHLDGNQDEWSRLDERASFH